MPLMNICKGCGEARCLSSESKRHLGLMVLGRANRPKVERKMVND